MEIGLDERSVESGSPPQYLEPIGRTELYLSLQKKKKNPRPLFGTLPRSNRSFLFLITTGDNLKSYKELLSQLDVFSLSESIPSLSDDQAMTRRLGLIFCLLSLLAVLQVESTSALMYSPLLLLFHLIIFLF